MGLDVMTQKVILVIFVKMTILPLPVVALSPNFCVLEVGLKKIDKKLSFWKVEFLRVKVWLKVLFRVIWSFGTQIGFLSIPTVLECQNKSMRVDVVEFGVKSKI